MKTERHNLGWLGSCLVALALVVSANGLAQGSAAPVTAGAEDMRLWSFGDCDRRFPYTNTDAHKECVRVVGSQEARDARALRVCEVSHQADREEIDRCKTAYKANKEKAAQDGVVANASAAAQAEPSPEVMRRVKAITTAAVEERRAATAAVAADPEPEEPAPLHVEESSSWVGSVGMVMLLAIVVGLGVNLMRRKQAQSA